MKSSRTLSIAMIGLALSVTACGEEAAEAQADETVAEAPEESAAAHDASAYAEDETGGQVNPALLTALNERLDSFHADSGKDLHIILSMTTDGADVETVAEEARAERDADALIYVAGQDQVLAIVGDGLSEDFITTTELAMIAQFEENNLADGLNLGVDAVIAELGN